MPALVSFSALNPAPVLDRPRPDRLVAGNPARHTWEYFTNPSGEVSAGIWACEPGAWRIQFADNKDEFFCVISGRVRLTDAEGRAHDIGPGEAAVIPAGFRGEFAVIEAVRKYYVVVERQG